MNWTQGYVSDIEYTVGFYRELAPNVLEHAAAINGVSATSSAASFRYCELACGYGFTTQILAACYPASQFKGYDFNPTHIAAATALSKAAEQENITFSDESFEQSVMPGAEQQQFDFITLHGIYSWVTPSNREYITKFLDKNLRPGGLAYLSYNCMPGWAAMVPIQRLLRDVAQLNAGRSDVQAEKAIEFIEALQGVDARYLQANPSISGRLSKLKSANRNYVAHEYLNGSWNPLFHTDVAAEMAAVKMTFIGSASLSENFMNACFTEAQRNLINSLPDPSLQETAKDFILNLQFRKDVFAKGVVRPSAVDSSDRMLTARYALLIPRSKCSLKFALSVGEVTGTPAIYDPILDALEGGPKSLKELSLNPRLANVPLSSLVQATGMLCASAQIAAVSSETRRDAAVKLNQQVAELARTSDTYQAFAAPLIGNGLTVGLVERLTYDALAIGTSENANSIAKHCWSTFERRGQTLVVEGRTLAGAAENLAELERQIDIILEQRLPIWQTLMIV